MLRETGQASRCGPAPFARLVVALRRRALRLRALARGWMVRCAGPCEIGRVLIASRMCTALAAQSAIPAGVRVHILGGIRPGRVADLAGVRPCLPAACCSPPGCERAACHRHGKGRGGSSTMSGPDRAESRRQPARTRPQAQGRADVRAAASTAAPLARRPTKHCMPGGHAGSAKALVL